MAAEQHVGHRPAAPVGRPRVVRVLGRAVERGAERLLVRRLLVPERARELAQHRVAHDHRRELAAREHVAADRELVGAEVLEDALVEALVAAAEQRQLVLGRQLLDDAVVEHPPAGRERDHAAALAHRDRVLAVAGAQRRLDDVDAEHHPRAAAERRVVDLPRLQRRVRAVVDALERGAQRQRVRHVALRRGTSRTSAGRA